MLFSYNCLFNICRVICLFHVEYREQTDTSTSTGGKYDILSITETWHNGTHDWNVVLKNYRLPKRGYV